jgi:DNA polymerase III gamma/tau subunit
MNKIIKSENITIDEPAKKIILSLCNNNVKILINYIEKFKLLGQNIDLELATNICTNISFNTFENYTELLKQGKLYDSIKILYSIFDKGYSVMDVLDNFFLFVKITNIITEDQK